MPASTWLMIEARKLRWRRRLNLISGSFAWCSTTDEGGQQQDADPERDQRLRAHPALRLALAEAEDECGDPEPEGDHPGVVDRRAGRPPGRGWACGAG